MESLTFYRFKHSENFSDNYKISFEKKRAFKCIRFLLWILSKNFGHRFKENSG